MELIRNTLDHDFILPILNLKKIDRYVFIIETETKSTHVDKGLAYRKFVLTHIIHYTITVLFKLYRYRYIKLKLVHFVIRVN